MPTDILMPALSPTMEEGKLAKWHVKEGDAVKSGDILAEIETDKATMEFEAVDEGRIGKILVPEGTEGVKVNQPIAKLLGDDEKAGAAPAHDIPAAMASIKDAVTAEAKEPAKPSAQPGSADAKPVGAGQGDSKTVDVESAEEKSGSAKTSGTKPDKPTPSSAENTTKPGGKRVFASPLARRIAQQKGIDIALPSGLG